MPPVTYVDHEPDNADGWWVAFHDADNLDGPHDAVFHMTPDTVLRLAAIEKRIGSPHESELVQVAAAFASGRPANPLPVINRFLAAYSALIQDRIDRTRLGVKASAPHSVLEDARQGQEIAAEHRRGPQTDNAYERLLERLTTG